jgi:hypothetical protein
MICLDEKILHGTGMMIWRIRIKLGLTHWQIISCVDALFAGSLVLMLLLSQHYLLPVLGAVAIFGASPSARRREFLPLEQAATLLHQPMKHLLRQEWAPYCWERYITCVLYAGLIARSLWEWDWIPVSVFVAGIGRAFAEAADIYPSGGKTVRDRSKLFLPTKATKEITESA